MFDPTFVTRHYAMKMNRTSSLQLHKNWIDPHALGIVKALQKEGHTTFLVGGCVRDLLLGLHPKDFDIGTSATPAAVKHIIHKAYVIGKRFRLVLVKRGLQQYEVATFRREALEGEITEGANLGDNLFGTPEEDAHRRDFTINALFYDPIQHRLIDYAHGLPDHEQRLIRMIGDPDRRLIEDPIRILRALRFSHKLRFTIEPELKSAMMKHAESLTTSVLPRRREEWLKLLRLAYPQNAFAELYDLGLLRFLSPHLHDVFENAETREIFLDYLSHLPETGLDRNHPIELFGFLIHAYVRAVIEPDPLLPLKSRELSEHEGLQKFMSQELGLFKTEQSVVLGALHVQTLLQRREEFERKGSRRQMALLSRDGFPLALKFSLADVSISPADWHYWVQLYWKSWLDIESRQETRAPKRRRKRRPRQSLKEELESPGSVD